jgi:lysophospholipase II
MLSTTRPRRAVSLNQGQCRPSWFNVSHLPPYPDEFDEAAIAGSVAIIENLILAQVHAGIDPRRIVLVGFSQGAALSMMVALTTLHDLGGVACLSGWIPRRARDVSVNVEDWFHIPTPRSRLGLILYADIHSR